MKKIEMIQPDFEGKVTRVRKAARGIVIDKDNQILINVLIEENGDIIYMIPGGGIEDNESEEAACVRELIEETGLVVKPIEKILEINEFFDSTNHLLSYFICEPIQDTGKIELTEKEESLKLMNAWIDFDAIYNIFKDYENYRDTNTKYYNLYRREFEGLDECKKYIESKKNRN